MSGLRQSVRPVLFAAACAALLSTACFPPIAWHDGLPAWSPELRDVEWRVGYHHLSAFDADTFELFNQEFVRPDFSISYLTPGVRWGIGNKSLAADIGFNSVLAVGNGLGLMVGPAFGVGHCDQNFSLMFRPSLSLFQFSTAEGGSFQFPFWYQLEVLAGNGYRTKGVSFSAGGRASPFAAGPVGLVGWNLHPVDIRAEVSYMWPISAIATGKALTAGISVAAPTKR